MPHSRSDTNPECLRMWSRNRAISASTAKGCWRLARNQRDARSRSRLTSAIIEYSTAGRACSATMSSHSWRISNTSVTTTKARKMSSGVAPVSSHSRWA
ncbi:Uncharacterised protein [Mycobacteroides abscessus subsp. abscessus]|nr:Uncharacterised protein [Mycobacteroides abscessus subsp. abscessus]